uniref:Uncharacterized protein n=1 Tax=Romanomermis culicivorax TaxID=13658 RepID=A0A915I5V6_ROMCU
MERQCIFLGCKISGHFQDQEDDMKLPIDLGQNWRKEICKTERHKKTMFLAKDSVFNDGAGMFLVDFCKARNGQCGKSPDTISKASPTKSSKYILTSDCLPERSYISTTSAMSCYIINVHRW